MHRNVTVIDSRRVTRIVETVTDRISWRRSGSLTCTPMQNRDGRSLVPREEISTRPRSFVRDARHWNAPTSKSRRGVGFLLVLARLSIIPLERVRRRSLLERALLFAKRPRPRARGCKLVGHGVGLTVRSPSGFYTRTYEFFGRPNRSFSLAESENAGDRSSDNELDPCAVSGRPRLSRTRAHLFRARAGQLVAGSPRR